MSRDLHPWRILDVHDGAVGWIQGKLIGEPPLVAPFSKRGCFYYSVLVEGRGAQNATAAELIVDDGSGHAIVELAGATIQVNYDHESWPPGYEPGQAGLLDLDHPVRREGVLAPGELIAVHGHCRWELDPTAQRHGLYRDPVPRRLRIAGGRGVKIWVTERL